MNKGLGRFGSYYLYDRLGQGGMASVFRAVRLGQGAFRHIVALKVIRPDDIPDEDFARYFRDEARLGQYLTHPNIVEVLDFGEVQGYLFMAMEYVNGPSLGLLHRCLRRRQEGIPPEIALQILSRICRGLDYAHRALNHRGEALQLVHRDVKPSNILLGPLGQVKLCDFGVARSSSNIRQTVTDGALRGTIPYMSPEQAWGQSQLDARSDLFSVGLILLELLTGRPVYDDNHALILLRRAQEAQVQSSLERVPRIPGRDALLQQLTRCLEKDPERRHATALALARQLEAMLEHFSAPQNLDDWLAEVCARECPLLARRWTEDMHSFPGDGAAGEASPGEGGGLPLEAPRSRPVAVAARAGEASPPSPETPVPTTGARAIGEARGAARSVPQSLGVTSEIEELFQRADRDPPAAWLEPAVSGQPGLQGDRGSGASDPGAEESWFQAPSDSGMVGKELRRTGSLGLDGPPPAPARTRKAALAIAGVGLLAMASWWWQSAAPLPSATQLVSASSPSVPEGEGGHQAPVETPPAPHLPLPTPGPATSPTKPGPTDAPERRSEPSPRPDRAREPGREAGLEPDPASAPPDATARLWLNASPRAAVRTDRRVLGTTPLQGVLVPAMSQVLTFQFESGQQVARRLEPEPGSSWTCFARLEDSIVTCLKKD